MVFKSETRTMSQDAAWWLQGTGGVSGVARGRKRHPNPRAVETLEGRDGSHGSARGLSQRRLFVPT